MGYFTVTVTFSSKDAADSFRNDVECMLEEKGDDGYMVVSVSQSEVEY